MKIYSVLGVLSPCLCGGPDCLYLDSAAYLCLILLLLDLMSQKLHTCLP